MEDEALALAAGELEGLRAAGGVARSADTLLDQLTHLRAALDTALDSRNRHQPGQSCSRHPTTYHLPTKQRHKMLTSYILTVTLWHFLTTVAVVTSFNVKIQIKFQGSALTGQSFGNKYYFSFYNNLAFLHPVLIFNPALFSAPRSQVILKSKTP